MSVNVQAIPKVSTARPGAIFTVFVVAGLIGGITLIERGQLPQGTLLALLLFLIIGALVPPVAIVVGAIIIAYLLLTGGALSLASWSNSLTSGKSTTAPPVGTYQPIAKSVP